jgi:hypothetical protein
MTRTERLLLCLVVVVSVLGVVQCAGYVMTHPGFINP